MIPTIDIMEIWRPKTLILGWIVKPSGRVEWQAGGYAKPPMVANQISTPQSDSSS